ncbi:MAG: hypothetical protein ACHQ0J_13545 [Candidatus Dormibacterales bacterium]
MDHYFVFDKKSGGRMFRSLLSEVRWLSVQPGRCKYVCISGDFSRKHLKAICSLAKALGGDYDGWGMAMNSGAAMSQREQAS